MDGGGPKGLAKNTARHVGGKGAARARLRGGPDSPPPGGGMPAWISGVWTAAGGRGAPIARDGLAVAPSTRPPLHPPPPPPPPENPVPLLPLPPTPPARAHLGVQPVQAAHGPGLVHGPGHRAAVGQARRVVVPHQCRLGPQVEHP